MNIANDMQYVQGKNEGFFHVSNRHRTTKRAFQTGVFLLTAWISRHLDELEQLYQHFHKNPELSFQEVETARRFAE